MNVPKQSAADPVPTYGSGRIALSEEVIDLSNVAGDGSGQVVRAPWSAASVAHVRHALVLDLEARGLPEQLIDEAEIVVSELVANAVRHATPLADGTMRVKWKVRGTIVEIDVTDGGGTTAPKPAPRAVWSPAGRGLRIVRSLAHEWGVLEERSGVTVWASLGGPTRRRAT